MGIKYWPHKYAPRAFALLRHRHHVPKGIVGLVVFIKRRQLPFVKRNMIEQIHNYVIFYKLPI